MPASLTIRPIEEGHTAAGKRGQAVRPPPAWATEPIGIQSAGTDATGCWSAGCARALVLREHTATETDGDGVETASMDNRRTTSMHTPWRGSAPAGAARPLRRDASYLDASRQARATREYPGARPPGDAHRRATGGHLPIGKPQGATEGHPPVGKERRECGSLPRFAVIPTECSVGGRRLMIICPYPFCDALEAARCERSA
jgi:hypothetical protein